MKTKIIAAALSFSATFGISTGLMQFAKETPAPQSYVFSSNNDQVRQKILLLLEQDIRNGKELDRNLRNFEGAYKTPFSNESLAKYSRAVDTYVNKSESLDYSDLPRHFQIAWRKHMKAWREHADAVNQMQRSPEIQTMTSEEFRRRFYAQDDAISRTWYKVLRIAGNHGAFPSDAY